MVRRLVDWKAGNATGRFIDILRTHRFIGIYGDIQCGLELGDHTRNEHSLEIYEIRDNEECAFVLT
jgi:hypothetical protein